MGAGITAPGQREAGRGGSSFQVFLLTTSPAQGRSPTLPQKAHSPSPMPPLTGAQGPQGHPLHLRIAPTIRAALLKCMLSISKQKYSLVEYI